MPALDRVSARIAGSLAAISATFRNPALRSVELAYIGFNLAEWATWIAILVYAYGRGGAGEVGLVMVIQLAPSAFVAPLAASFGDRFPRGRVLFGGYLLQAGAAGALASALLLGAPVLVIYPLAALSNAALTITRPVQAAIFPGLARTPSELTAANVAAGAIETSSILIGPALAGVIVQAFGPSMVYALSAVALMAGSALLVGLARRDTAAADRHVAAGLRGAISEAVGGFPLLVSEPKLRAVVVLLGASSVLWGVLDVLLVVLAIELLAMGQSGVGFLNAALGGGGMIGAALAVLLIGRPRLAVPFGIGIGLWGLCLALVGALPIPALAIVMLALAGMGRVLMDVAGRTLLQRVSADEALSRVFGVLEGIHQASLALGAVLAPALILLAGAPGAFLIAGLGLVAVTGLNWRRLLQADATGVVRARELRLLLGIPFFAPLDGPALERLAAALIAVDLGAGSVIIRQGDPGDRFYIVAEGEVVVTVDGRQVRSQGPGESFGEIALLRNVPRTATVTASTEVELLALDRHLFLEVLTGQPDTERAAHSVIDQRLQA